MNKIFHVVYCGDIPLVARSLIKLPYVRLVGWLYEAGDEDAEILTLSEQMDIPAVLVENAMDVQKALNQMGDMDLGVIANFGIILSGQNLSSTRRGFINAHLGLLPDNPGRHPIHDAIEQEKRITGVTLHWAEIRVDSGPVIDQRVISMGVRKNAEEIFDRLVSWIPVLLMKNLRSVLEDEKEVSEVPFATIF